MGLWAGAANVEKLCQAWLATTDVNTLAAGRLFLAMPLDAALPAVTMSRVGGGPATRDDLPYERVRMSFSVWTASRSQGQAINAALVVAIENVGQTGGFFHATYGRLYAAETITSLWSPDKESDTPRYITDGLFAVISA